MPNYSASSHVVPKNSPAKSPDVACLQGKAEGIKEDVVPIRTVFLRKKRINGSDYWYLVETYREDGKVRQRVVKYIGSDERLASFREGVRE